MLDDLNLEQRKSASIIDGPVRTVAGPGSGKTKTKVSRIARMILEKGIEPDSIVALTFTNAAADEMRQRIARAVGQDGYRVFTGTYHSYFIQKILKPNQNHEYFHRTGYKDGFYVMTDSDTDRLLNTAIKNSPGPVRDILDALDIGKRRVKSWMGNHRSHGLVPSDVIGKLKQDQTAMDQWGKLKQYISIATADGAKFSELKGAIQDFRKKCPAIAEIAQSFVWRSYMKECTDNNGMDFDDVLVHAARLLRYDDNIGRRIASQHRYFSLDEFQDTNPVQFHVITGIVKHHGDKPNVFTVGDARQSIYGFRNADVRLMVDMDKTFPGTQTVSLVVNYRSSQELIDASNLLAKTMNGQITDGQLRSFKGNIHDKPVIASFDTDDDEARFVVQAIQSEIVNGTSPEEIVVLYRARAARENVEKSLLENEVPYQIIGDTSFWERKEVLDCLALTRLLTRENDPVALYRVLDAGSFGVTPLTLRKNADKASMGPKTYLRNMAMGNGLKAKRLKPLTHRLAAFKSAVPLFDKPQIRKLAPEFYVKLMKSAQNENQVEGYVKSMTNDERKEAYDYGEQLAQYNASQIADCVKAVYEDLLWPKLKDSEYKRLSKAGLSAGEIGEKITDRWESVKKFFEIFESVQSTAPSLDTIVDELTLRAESSNENKADQVKLMTNHASKGLEYKVVFMIGSEKEMYLRDSEEADPERLDEEIRNFYTAMTRAESKLTVSHAENRWVNGELRVHSPFPAIEIIAPACAHQDQRSETPERIDEISRRANETCADDIVQEQARAAIGMTI